MSRWQSHIDQILGDARARAAGQDSANKTASAPSVLDAAKEAADALDFVAHQDPGTGASLRQFFVEKAALAPAVSPTMTTGEQAEPPRKTGKPAASPSGGSRPAVSGAPTGQMPVMPISQEGTSLVAKKATAAGAGMSPPAQHGLDWNPIARGPQDDPLTWSPGQWTPANAKVASQAEGTTLFDIVMQGRTASKEAMSPAQYVGGQDSGAAPSANEGSLTRFLASNEAAVGYTKRDAKLPTRARIKEVFQNVDDPANGEAARAAFPHAAAVGGLKVAEGGYADKLRNLGQRAENFRKAVAGSPVSKAGTPLRGGAQQRMTLEARKTLGKGALGAATAGALAYGGYRAGKALMGKKEEAEEKSASSDRRLLHLGLSQKVAADVDPVISSEHSLALAPFIAARTKRELKAELDDKISPALRMARTSLAGAARGNMLAEHSPLTSAASHSALKSRLGREPTEEEVQEMNRLGGAAVGGLTHAVGSGMTELLRRQRMQSALNKIEARESAGLPGVEMRSGLGENERAMLMGRHKSPGFRFSRPDILADQDIPEELRAKIYRDYKEHVAQETPRTEGRSALRSGVIGGALGALPGLVLSDKSIAGGGALAGSALGAALGLSRARAHQARVQRAKESLSQDELTALRRRLKL